MTNELMKTSTNKNGDIIVSGVDLHEFLEIKTPYKKWFDRMSEYGFEENVDFAVLDKFVHDDTAFGNKRNITDHVIKLDMAKEISMIQRSEKGKQARLYFLEIEKAWNSPEMVMKRAMDYLNERVEQMQLEINQQKPKVLLADSISDSGTTILIRELAKLIKQNGVDIGEKRLYVWLRENGYLVKNLGVDYNTPTQRSMDLGLFRIKESTFTDSKGIKISKTTKVTGKGQAYFINKFLNK